MPRAFKQNPGLWIVAALLILGNISGATRLLFAPEVIQQRAADLGIATIRTIGVIPLASIVGLLALLAGRRWGYGLTAAAFCLAAVFDIKYGIYRHLVLASASFLLLTYFVFARKHYFTHPE
jgi:hypothetical protein